MAENKEKTGLKTHWQNIKTEFHKIIWPAKDYVAKQTLAVVVISVVMGGLIAIIDYVIKAGLGLIL